MPSVKSVSRSLLLSATAMLLTLSTPLLGLGVAAADCQPPDPSTQAGVHFPVGADAGTFTYQCTGTYTGEWTNAYYVYNPSTSSRSPLYDRNYSYDCTTGKWTMTEWDYSPGDSQYHQYRVVTSNPGQATNCPVAPVVAAGASGSGSAAAGASTSTGSNANNGGINSTGPGSSNTINADGTVNQTFNNTTNATMNNTITGVATSGNSLVIGNTTAGGATSGDTQDIANVVNMLQSSSNALGAGSNVVTFTSNINGDVNGDFYLDPSQLANVQGAGTVANTGPGSTNSLNHNLNDNLTVNNSTNADINNNINLASKSGDATVSSNTNGGDATTGTAKAVANIVNTINSALTAGKSFIGTININGNLNGDILLPDNFVSTLLAANTPTVTITGPSSSNNVNDSSNSNTTVNNTNNLGINNNVKANAGTGSANVSNNTSGGNASSGNATTNITAFNLTGSDVIGANDILVFVNAPGGKWVGVIVNAPAGATAASLGGGIASTGPNSKNNVNDTQNSNTTVNNTINGHINNNITTNANSGNANVSSNTKGGNARTGDANSAVNLLNVQNSHLTLSGWLGILFINVFGTWHGSFGINTSAGDPIMASQVNNAVATTNGGTGFNSPAQIFSFVAHGSSAGNAGDSSVSGTGGNSNTNNASASNALASVLAAQTVKASKASIPQLQAAHSGLGRTLAIIGGATLFFIVSDAFFSRRKAHRV